MKGAADIVMSALPSTLFEQQLTETLRFVTWCAVPLPLGGKVNANFVSDLGVC